MLANRVRQVTTTTGTGDVTLGGALPAHITFADAFTTGDSVTYVIEDGDNYEIGTGTLIAVDTLERSIVSETLVDGVYTKTGAAAIALSGNARVFCAATAAFLLDPVEVADVISEATPGAGVTADNVLLRDGNITLGGDHILRNVDNDQLVISGGDQVGRGGNLFLYGAEHPTNSGDILFRTGANNIMFYDASNSLFRFYDRVTIDGNTTIGGNLSAGGTVNFGGGNSLLTADYADLAIGNQTGNSGVTIQSTGTGRGGIAFSYGNTTSVASRQGRFDFDHNSSAFEWITADAVRMFLSGTDLDIYVPTNFQGNDITTTGVGKFGVLTGSDTTGALDIYGGLGSTGANLILYASGATDANDILFRTGGTARLRWDNSAAEWNFQGTKLGRVGPGNGIALTIGADGTGTELTDNTQKIGRLASPHYANAELPIALVWGNSGPTFNHVSIGGGTSFMNTATALNFYTATNNTTTVGNLALSIDSTGNANFQGNDITGIGKLEVDSGAKISVQNKVDGGSGNGIFLWDTDSTQYGIYTASSGVTKSLSDGTACTSLDGRTFEHVRQRVTNSGSRGFIWENSAEQCLMSLTADTGDLYTKGDVYVGADKSFKVQGTTNQFRGLVPDNTTMNLLLGTGMGTEPRIYLYGSTNGQSTAGDIYLATANEAGTIILNSDTQVAKKLTVDGDLILSGDGYAYQSSSTGGAFISGGTYIDQGANIQLFAESHTTTPNDILFRSGGVVQAQWDENATTWRWSDRPFAGLASIRRGTGNGDFRIAGGTGTSDGANIRLYGESHLTNANDMVFSSGGTPRMTWDETGGFWSLHGNNLLGLGGVLGRSFNAGSLSINGGSAQSTGGNFLLYGPDHANANDIEFKANTSIKLKWDDSEGYWDVQGNNIVGVGDLTVGGEIFVPDGTAASPTYTFTTDSDTGMYLSGSTLGFSAGGSSVILLNAQGVINSKNGLESSPSYTFESDSNTGVYRVSADRLGISGGGVNRAIIGSNSGVIPNNNGGWFPGGDWVSLAVGSDSTGTTLTDATNKAARIGMPHYTLAEQPVGIVFGFSNATQNIVNIGGGSSQVTAATDIQFYTASNTTTTAGILVGSVDIDRWTFENLVSLGSPTELTISSGAITVTKSFHTVDTEGDAATDDIDTINGGTDGDEIILSIATGSRIPTFKHATGNIRLKGGTDFVPTSVDDILRLIFLGDRWREVSRSNNA